MQNEFLNEVYAAVRHISGVEALTNRRKSDILFLSNVEVTTAVYAALVAKYGEPTTTHPMLAQFEWKLGERNIFLPRASTLSSNGVLNRLTAY